MRTTFWRVFSSRRALTNWLGKRVSLGLAKVARNLTVPVVVVDLVVERGEPAGLELLVVGAVVGVDGKRVVAAELGLDAGQVIF